MTKWKRCACAELLVCMILPSLSATAVRASTYTQVNSILQHLKSSQNTRLITLTSSGQGRPLVGAAITDPGSPVQAKARVIIIAGQHGNEPNPALSSAQLALRWATEPALEDLRRHAIVMIIPAANPDGLAGATRFDGSGLDLNRDWSRRTQSETSAIARTIDQWKPHLVIDEHEWSRTDGYRFNCIELSQTCPNADLVTLARRLRRDAACVGFAEIDSQPGRNLSLLHRYCAARGYLSYLVETSPAESASEKREMYCSVSIALTRRAVAAREAIDACSASANGYELPAQLVGWHRSRPARQIGQVGVQVGVVLAALYCLLLVCGRRTTLPEGSPVAVRVRYRPMTDTAPVTPHGLVPELTCRSRVSRRIRRAR